MSLPGLSGAAIFFVFFARRAPAQGGTMNLKLVVTIEIDDWKLGLSVGPDEFLNVLDILLPHTEIAVPVRAQLEELRKAMKP